MSQKTHVSTDFADESIRGGLSDRPETYKGKTGRRDKVRIVTMPLSFFGARVEFKHDKNKGFFAISHANHADAKAGNMPALKKQCPLYRRGYTVGERFVVLLWWISSIDSKGREVKKDAVLPWVFAGERYSALRNIQAALPPVASTGQKRTILSCELLIECTDDNFQKMNITHILPPSTKLAEVRARVSEYFTEEAQATLDPSGCSLLLETVEPEPLANLENSLDRAEGRGRFAEEARADEFDAGEEADPEEDAPAPAPAARRAPPARAPAARPAARPVAPEEPEPGEDDAIEEDPDEAAPAPVRKAAPAPAARKPAAAPAPAKKAPAPAKKAAPAPSPEDEAEAALEEVLEDAE